MEEYFDIMGSSDKLKVSVTFLESERNAHARRYISAGYYAVVQRADSGGTVLFEDAKAELLMVEVAEPSMKAREYAIERTKANIEAILLTGAARHGCLPASIDMTF